MKKYDVAAYIWPVYTGDEPRTRIFLGLRDRRMAVGQKRDEKSSPTITGRESPSGVV